MADSRGGDKKRESESKGTRKILGDLKKGDSNTTQNDSGGLLGFTKSVGNSLISSFWKGVETSLDTFDNLVERIDTFSKQTLWDQKILGMTDKDIKLLKRQDDKGNTLLHYAALYNRPEVVSHLIKILKTNEREHYLNMTNVAGQTPLDIALDNAGNSELSRNDQGTASQIATSLRDAIQQSQHRSELKAESKASEMGTEDVINFLDQDAAKKEIPLLTLLEEKKWDKVLDRLITVWNDMDQNNSNISSFTQDEKDLISKNFRRHLSPEIEKQISSQEDKKLFKGWLIQTFSVKAFDILKDAIDEKPTNDRKMGM